MKRPWTRGEKLLWTVPLLCGLVAAAVNFWPKYNVPLLARPRILSTTPGMDLRSMALSRNGEVVAAAGQVRHEGSNGQTWTHSGKVYLWNARTGERLTPIYPVYTRVTTRIKYRVPSPFMPQTSTTTRGTDINALTFSPDAKRIGFLRQYQDWALYDVWSSKQLWRFPSPNLFKDAELIKDAQVLPRDMNSPFIIKDAAFSPDGRFIALSSASHVFIVSARDGRLRTRWKINQSTSDHSIDIAWSPDGKWIASIGSYYEGNPIELRQADNGKIVRRVQHSEPIGHERVASVAFSSDGKRLVTASSTSSGTDEFPRFAPLRCYNATTGRLLWQVKGSSLSGENYSMAEFSRRSAFCDAIFSPDGRFVAAYNYLEGKVFLLDSATGEIKTSRELGPVARPSGGSGSTLPSLAFSPDSKRLFARGSDAVVYWDLKLNNN